MPRALITGGAGFFGSHVCDRLLAEGWEVICLDNLVTGTTDNIAHIHDRRFTFVDYDVTNFLYVEGPLDAVLRLNTGWEAGKTFAESYEHESNPRILAGFSIGGDAALRTGSPLGGGNWDLRVVVGARVDTPDLFALITAAAETSNRFIMVNLVSDVFGFDRSYQTLVRRVSDGFGSLEGFYERYPNVQIEHAYTGHAGAGRAAATQDAIRRGHAALSRRERAAGWRLQRFRGN